MKTDLELKADLKVATAHFRKEAPLAALNSGHCSR
jgi:hypothetical protein